MVSARIGSGRTSAPRPAHADSISVCMRAESNGTRSPRSVTISAGAATAGGRALLGALLRAPLAVEHVGARDLVVAAAHQAELDLVLHVLDVERAAARTRAQQARERPIRSGRRRSRERSPRPRPACRGRRGTPSSARPRSCSARTKRRRRCGAGSGSPGTPMRPARAGPRARRGRRSDGRRLGGGCLHGISSGGPGSACGRRAFCVIAGKDSRPALAVWRLVEANQDSGEPARGLRRDIATTKISDSTRGHYIWGLNRLNNALPIAYLTRT